MQKGLKQGAGHVIFILTTLNVQVAYNIPQNASRWYLRPLTCSPSKYLFWLSHVLKTQMCLHSQHSHHPPPPNSAFFAFQALVHSVEAHGIVFIKYNKQGNQTPANDLWSTFNDLHSHSCEISVKSRREVS